MRKPTRLFAHDQKGLIPRMSWSPHNLYNIVARSLPVNASAIAFRQVSATMYQQRWQSKRFVRGYHGDWIGERKFRRWYLPTTVPNLTRIKRRGVAQASTLDTIASSGSETGRLPVTSLFLREVERRLDTTVFRCCFARSAREARSMIVQGHVKVNGVKTASAGMLLNPGDLISVTPSAIPMLSPTSAKRATEMAETEQEEPSADATTSSSGVTEKTESRSSAEESADDEESKEPVTADTGTIRAAKDGHELSKEDAVGVENAEDQDVSVGGVEGINDRMKSREASQEKEKGKTKEKEQLDPGVFPFTLPPFAAPFIFVPAFLEVSFTTCSAIYLRHPTITPAPRASHHTGRQHHAENRNTKPSVPYLSDIPSPYPATGHIFSLAWELYARDAPRIRSDVRRIRLESRVGRNGMRTARAKDEWRKVLAIRRRRDRQPSLQR